MQDRNCFQYYQILYILYKLVFDYILIRLFSDFNWYQGYIKQNRKLKINYLLLYFLNLVIMLIGYLFGYKILDYLKKKKKKGYLNIDQGI